MDHRHGDEAPTPRQRFRVPSGRLQVLAGLCAGCAPVVIAPYIMAMIYNYEWPSEEYVWFRRYRPRVYEQAMGVGRDFKDADYFCRRSPDYENLGWFCEADLVAAGEYLNAIGDAQLAALSLVPVIMLLYAMLVCLIAPTGLATRGRLVLATLVIFLLGAFISVTVFVTTSRLHAFNAEGHGGTIPPPANWNWESKPALMYSVGVLFAGHWLATVVMGVIACASSLMPLDDEGGDNSGADHAHGLQGHRARVSGDDSDVDIFEADDFGASGHARRRHPQAAAFPPSTDTGPVTADGDIVMGVPAVAAFSPKLADLVGGKDDVRAFLQRERVRTFADLEDCLTWGVLPGSREGAWLWKMRDPAVVVPEAEGGASLIAFIRHLVDQRSRRPEFEKLSDIPPA